MGAVHDLLSTLFLLCLVGSLPLILFTAACFGPWVLSAAFTALAAPLIYILRKREKRALAFIFDPRPELNQDEALEWLVDRMARRKD